MTKQDYAFAGHGVGVLMAREWNDDQPIYRQLMDEFIGLILDGTFKEGGPMPSVRQVATTYEINPLTAAKVYQELVSESLLEKRRGIGMFVRQGVRDALLKAERKKFLRDEWPTVVQRIEQLGLDPRDLIRKS